MLLDGDEVGECLEWMNGSCLHSEDWAPAVLYKLVYDGFGIIVVTVFQTGKATNTDKVAEATHHRDSLQQVLALVAIHDNATLCLQFPCTGIHIEHDYIHAQVHRSLLCTQSGTETVIEEYHQQGFVLAQLLITETVCFHFLCLGERCFQVAKVFNIKECLHCYFVFCLLFLIYIALGSFFLDLDVCKVCMQTLQTWQKLRLGTERVRSGSC